MWGWEGRADVTAELKLELEGRAQASGVSFVYRAVLSLLGSKPRRHRHIMDAFPSHHHRPWKISTWPGCNAVLTVT